MAIDALSSRIAANPLQGFKIADIVASKFDEGDTNKDGKFSVEEYKTLAEQSAFAPAISAGGVTAEEIFARIDADQDGAVSKKEFIERHGEGVVSASGLTLGLRQSFAANFSQPNISTLLKVQEERSQSLLDRLGAGASQRLHNSNPVTEELLNQALKS